MSIRLPPVVTSPRPVPPSPKAAASPGVVRAGAIEVGSRAELDEWRAQHERARRSTSPRTALPFAWEFPTQRGSAARVRIEQAARRLGRGDSLGIMIGVDEEPGYPLAPLKKLEADLFTDWVAEVFERIGRPVRIDITAFGVDFDERGDVVEVTRPAGVRASEWDDEDLTPAADGDEEDEDGEAAGWEDDDHDDDDSDEVALPLAPHRAVHDGGTGYAVVFIVTAAK